MAFSTLLVINGPGFAPYSARGLTQTLEYIDAAGVFGRTINGKLINLAPSQMGKFRTTITGKDIEPPAFNLVKKGSVLTMHCAIELGFHTATDSPIRSVVPGSSRVVDNYTYYRPVLIVVVTSWSASLDEWPHDNQWQLEAEEQ